MADLVEGPLTERDTFMLRRLEQLLDRRLANFGSKIGEITDRLAMVEVDVGRAPATRTNRVRHNTHRRDEFVVHDNHVYLSDSLDSPPSRGSPRSPAYGSDVSHVPFRQHVSDGPLSSADDSASRHRRHHELTLRQKHHRDVTFVRGRRGRPQSGRGGFPTGGDFHHHDAPYPPHRDSHEFHMHIDIPPFNGTLGIEEFLDWLADVDRFFEHANISKDRQASLVACRLKAGASAWGDHVLRDRDQCGKAKIHSWRKLRGLFVDEFLPPDYDQTPFRQYQRCQQGSRTVHKYTCEFHCLSTRNNLADTPSQQVARYLDGLLPPIRNRIGIQTIHTLKDAKGFALKAELLLQQSSFREPTPTDRDASSPTPTEGTPSAMAQTEKKTSATPQGRSTHPIVPSLYARCFGGRCYRCGQQGHTSNACLDHRTTNLT